MVNRKNRKKVGLAQKCVFWLAAMSKFWPIANLRLALPRVWARVRGLRLGQLSSGCRQWPVWWPCALVGFVPAPACRVWVSRVCAGNELVVRVRAGVWAGSVRDKELLLRCFCRDNLEFGPAEFGLAEKSVGSEP